MNESFVVRFRRPSGAALRVVHADSTGVIFDEADAYARALSFEFDARTPGTQVRLDSVRQAKGWSPFSFVLPYTVDTGRLKFAGVDAFSLPHGSFWCKVRVAGFRIGGARVNFTIDPDGQGDAVIDVEPDPRTVTLRDLDHCDAEIARVIDAPGTLEGADARDWLESAAPRPTRKACLLNLMARMRVFPAVSDPLVADVLNVFTVKADRIYAEVDPGLPDRLIAMAGDVDNRKVWAEGAPHHPVHLKLLDALPEADPQTFELFSFRGEGSHSVQVVIARNPGAGRRCYAEFDIDAGNPYQDVLGFLIHMGELLDGKPTNHLDMWSALNKGVTKKYLYYRVTQ